MKKLFSVMVFIMMTVIMNTNCTKCNDTPDPVYGDITMADLTGTWTTTSYGNATECSQLSTSAYESDKYTLINYVFNGVNVKFTDRCNPTNEISNATYAVTVKTNPNRIVFSRPEHVDIEYTVVPNGYDTANKILIVTTNIDTKKHTIQKL